jgi:hypothetical protein
MSHMPAAGLADGTRIRISGTPTPEEITAVVMALDQAAAADAARRRRPRPPAWQYAGRLEAVGGRIVRAPADLDAP